MEEKKKVVEYLKKKVIDKAGGTEKNLILK